MLTKLFSKIENLKKLTTAEAKIVSYFQENEKHLALKTIYEISEGAHVSTATVTRFVVRIGYRDFNDFKTSINNELMGSLDSSWERYQLSKKRVLEGAEDTWSRFCSMVIKDLEAAHASISCDMLNHAAVMLAKAKGTVYVIGQFNSYIIAHLLFQQLTLLRPRVIFLNNQSGNMTHQMIDVGEEDVLFAVSYQRYSHPVTLTVKEFAKKGAQIIVLNDSTSSPVSPYAAIELTAPISWPAVFGSRCSGLMVVEGLAVIMAQTLEDTVADRITNAMIVADEFNSFTHKIKQNKLFQKGLASKDD